MAGNAPWWVRTRALAPSVGMSVNLDHLLDMDLG
jgi:hypothetical protein